jgi:hypothetical protein
MAVFTRFLITKDASLVTDGLTLGLEVEEA